MTLLPATALYKERVLPSVLFYIASMTIPLSLLLVALPISEVVSFSLAIASIPVILVFSWLASPLISLSEERLSVGQASIERKHLGDAQLVSPQDAFQERGVSLDSRAFTKFQIGVKQLVRIEIKDSADPTPYWLISTRNPEVLVGLINKI